MKIHILYTYWHAHAAVGQKGVPDLSNTVLHIADDTGVVLTELDSNPTTKGHLN